MASEAGCPVTSLQASDCSPSRTVARARRLVLDAASEHLGRTVTEASVALGLNVSAGSKLLCRSRERHDELEPIAAALASCLRKARQ